MSYIRHDRDCQPVPVQPSYEEVEENGQVYRNYNGDYVKHDKDCNPVEEGTP